MNAAAIPIAARETPLPTSERILDGLAEPVVVVNADGEIVYANTAGEKTFGVWLVGRSLADLFPYYLHSGQAATVGRVSTLTTEDHTKYIARFEPMENGLCVVSLHAGGAANHEDGPACDELTGLATRNCFMRALDVALVERGDLGEIAVHCIDLDRFKLVNDTLGHAIGDALLKKVAERLAKACRKEDVVARIGGDEFVVLQCAPVREGEAERLANRLVDLLGRTYVLNGHTVNIGASVGLAYSGSGYQGRDVMRNADLALYEAKRAGRARFRCFEFGMDANLRERRELEIDLRRALALKQFELHYQPFLDLKSNRVIGFEALLRWHHPRRGNVPPLDFIPLAEETGLIVTIGEWVLRSACEAAANWPGDMVAAVNVSPLQFKSDTLLETVSSALERSGLPASRLEVEITEGALLDDTENVLATLHALRDLGVHISMDDFGTGYSSLAYLQKFPFSKIKLDRSFVAGTGADCDAILKAVAGLGTSLGMAITAEGVETDEQLNRIREERCTYVQGYLTGRPMTVDRIARFLENGQQRTEAAS
ncbi:EAL domain-containing protein [Pararhizobium mangrovi]|nr:EAL domain-containing protein [Pararhizobium mangrovi]